MIYIPEEHYVGLQGRVESHTRNPDGTYTANEQIILGFATPVATDKAYEKRKGTVDSWVSNYQNQFQKDDPRRIPKVYPNKLTEGFELSRVVRRSGGWNGGNTLWRVIDPRGFELEISSANFASIVDCTTIVNGVIQGRCIWGRDGAANILLPENSEPYQEFVKLTELQNQATSQTMSVKDLQPGYIIQLTNGDKVEYLGKFYCIKHEYLEPYDDHIRRKGEGSAWNKVVERFAYKTTRTEGRKWNATEVELVSRLKFASVVDMSNVTDINENAKFITQTESARKFGEYIYVQANKLTTKDISLSVVEADTETAIKLLFKPKERGGYSHDYICTPFYFCKNANGQYIKVSDGSSSWHQKPLTDAFVSAISHVISIDYNGAYTVSARDRSYSAPQSMSKESLMNATWYKVVMTYGDYTTDLVRF